jgi:transposase
MCSIEGMSLDLNKLNEDEVRQVARLLVTENEELHRRLQKLSSRLDKLEGADAHTLQLEIDNLQRKLNKGHDSTPRSERRRPHRRKKKNSRRKRSGGARTPQVNLPHIDDHRTLDEADRRCSSCGGTAVAMGDACEESEVVDIVERSFNVRRVRRQKYVHGCDCAPKKIVVAPGPLRVVSGSRYTLAFAVAVAVAKFADHMPLGRQASQMRRQGLHVRPNVLYTQTEKLAELLEPTWEEIRREILDQPVVGADETGWPMLEKGRQKWQVWTLTTPKATFLSIRPRKDTANGKELLARELVDGEPCDPFDGVVVADGAPVYGAINRELGHSFTVAHCWSHVRRKFFECAPDYPAAETALDIIAKLYDVERDAMSVPLQERLALRKARAAPALDDLRDWMNESATRWDGSALNKAIRYTDERWDSLRIFLEHAQVPIHNNASEFALRKPVLGRKNFYGSKSRDGAKVASILYTLLETARKCEVDPTRYLQLAAETALKNREHVLLPIALSD